MKENKKVEMMQTSKLEGYSGILDDIKSLLERAKLQAYKAVDNIRVETYWQVGERIVMEKIKYNRAGYGKEIIRKLSRDLEFSEALLQRTIQFYRSYPILVTVSRELSWSHYRLLIREAVQAVNNSIILF